MLSLNQTNLKLCSQSLKYICKGASIFPSSVSNDTWQTKPLQSLVVSQNKFSPKVVMCSSDGHSVKLNHFSHSITNC